MLCLLRWHNALWLNYTPAGGSGSKGARCLKPKPRVCLSLAKKKQNLLFTAEPKWPGGLVGPSGGSSGGCVFFFFTLSLTQAHARTPTHVCGGSHSRTSGHVHGRLQEFCVYSGNKKWARNVNSGLSDCRRTVAVIDFYKHPLQTSVWAERATAGHTHSSRGQRERGTEKKKKQCRENRARQHHLRAISWLIVTFASVAINDTNVCTRF